MTNPNKGRIPKPWIPSHGLAQNDEQGRAVIPAKLVPEFNPGAGIQGELMLLFPRNFHASPNKRLGGMAKRELTTHHPLKIVKEERKGNIVWRSASSYVSTRGKLLQ